MPKLRVKLGFTLIELLVVISIIAILISVATVSYTNAQQKGRDSRRKSDLKAVQQALEIYFNQNGKYPETDAGKVKCSGAASGIAWGASFTCSSITFMNPLPKDPSFNSDTTKNYYYNSTSPYSTYILSGSIENTNDPDKNPLFLPCTPQVGRNYCVQQP